MDHTAVEASPNSRGPVKNVKSRARTNASRTKVLILRSCAREKCMSRSRAIRPAVATSHSNSTV